MLGLVISSNIFQIYIFWELVGVSSYLLIGYYYDKPSAVAASKKAFIVTRFADLGFLIGILILAFYGGTLDFNTLIQRLTDHAIITIHQHYYCIISWCFCINMGIDIGIYWWCRKIAMFPLHIWLPDAMEGPTPVSALIHAATMVVAGVYLGSKIISHVFHHTKLHYSIVTWVGAISAFLAAIIACTQTDIKRVLAYSTMSQIGYMMFALGVSGNMEGSGIGIYSFHVSFIHACIFQIIIVPWCRRCDSFGT